MTRHLTDFQAVAWNTSPVDAWATDALAATGGVLSHGREGNRFPHRMQCGSMGVWGAWT